MKVFDFYAWIGRNLIKARVPMENPKYQEPDITIDGNFITSTNSYLDDINPENYPYPKVVKILPVSDYGYYIVRPRT